MKTGKVKEQARQSLKALRSEHPELESLYFQGSITFANDETDFDPETSDIDGVAIVPDEVPVEREDELRNKLDKQTRWEVGLRLLFHRDLNGEARDSHLATFVDPKALLYAFPDWEHVAGVDHRAEDFDLAPVKHEEVIKAHIDKVMRPETNADGDWSQASQIDAGDYKYYLNNLSRLIDALQNKREGRSPFSYSGLVDRAHGLEERVARALLGVRRVRKNEGEAAAYNVFKQHAPIFQQYAEAVYQQKDVTKPLEQLDNTKKQNRSPKPQLQGEDQ